MWSISALFPLFDLVNCISLGCLGRLGLFHTMHGALRVTFEDILMVLSIGFSVIDGVLFWSRGHHQGCYIIHCIFKRSIVTSLVFLSCLFFFYFEGLFHILALCHIDSSYKLWICVYHWSWKRGQITRHNWFSFSHNYPFPSLSVRICSLWDFGICYW